MQIQPPAPGDSQTLQEVGEWMCKHAKEGLVMVARCERVEGCQYVLARIVPIGQPPDRVFVAGQGLFDMQGVAMFPTTHARLFIPLPDVVHASQCGDFWNGGVSTRGEPPIDEESILLLADLNLQIMNRETHP